jgi:hypothetical protein
MSVASHNIDQDSPALAAPRYFSFAGSHPRSGEAAGEGHVAPHVSFAERTGAPAATEVPLDVGLSPRELCTTVSSGDAVVVVVSAATAVYPSTICVTRSLFYTVVVHGCWYVVLSMRQPADIRSCTSCTKMVK